MLKPIYLDLHIHTSENPDNLNTKYDVKTLIDKMLKYNGNSSCLISLTDHNTINKKAYEDLLKKAKENSLINVILGVELHIRNYDDADPYHAHLFFNIENIIDEIDNINKILNELYPTKVVTSNMKNIPHIETIIKSFDKYDFILLPHGGQNHSTFDKSIPKGKNFDDTLERTIYYNQFDGFTARSNKGIDETIKYFKKLNINDFVNLITGTDNYNPSDYPNPKAGDKASEFVPTWMLALPTFDGLRISLSESNRLVYGSKPELSTQIINGCKLSKNNINIDVQFSNGLNVIIGESSSGKSLLIDSIYRNINNNFEGCVYNDYSVQDIEVNNPQGFYPHYINQNYIVEKINNKKINEIEIIKSLFPLNESEKKEVDEKLSELNNIIKSIISNVKNIEDYQIKIRKIPVVSNLIYEGTIQENPMNPFMLSENIKENIIDKITYNKYIKNLEEISTLSKNNAFMNNVSSEINKVKNELTIAYKKGCILTNINEIIDDEKKNCDEIISKQNGEKATKKIQLSNLLKYIKSYIMELNSYNDNLNKLLLFDYKIKTKNKECGGHFLSVVNELCISETKIIEAINKYLKSEDKINKLKELKPEKLFLSNLIQRPKVENYDDLANKIYKQFSDINEEKYEIKTSNEKDFDKLSPGWKTAILLDLIFNSKEDNAPLLIDQPEDNLASTYLNGDLINAIQTSKKKRQILIVSHNATIPMLGDAQNVIVCENKDGIINIKNAPLEGEINGKKVIDYVAKLTDGGKTAIKKRFKKYNLKKYRGDENETNS